jgi:G3E family GTPase
LKNEFGEVGIDNELVIGADEEIFEMNNGCICCTVRGDLIRILGNLVKRKDRLDAVLIETTGLADPAPVAQTFFVDDEVRNAFRIDAIVTLVDAKHVWQHIETSSECQEQIAFADVTLINKTDLVDEAALAKLEAKIRSMNSVAKIHRTQNAAIALDCIFNIRAFDLDNALAFAPDFLKPEMPFEWAGVYELEAGIYDILFQPDPDPEMNIVALCLGKFDDTVYESAKKTAVRLFSTETVSRASGTQFRSGVKLQKLEFGASGAQFQFQAGLTGQYVFFTQHPPDEFKMAFTRSGRAIPTAREETFAANHTHDQSVSSVGIIEKCPVDGKKFNAWLGDLLRKKGADIYRMKGIVNVKDQPNRFVFQGVHMLFDGKLDRPWKNAGEAGNQFVFIGKNLDRQELEKGFRSCLA